MCLNVPWVGMSGVWWDQLALTRLWEGKLGCAAVQSLLNPALAPCCCVAALQSLFSRISLEQFSWANTGLFLHDQLRAIRAFWCYLRVSLPSLLPQGFSRRRFCVWLLWCKADVGKAHLGFMALLWICHFHGKMARSLHLHKELGWI